MRRRVGLAVVMACALACVPGDGTSEVPRVTVAPAIELDAEDDAIRDTRTDAPIVLRTRSGSRLPLRVVEVRGTVQSPLAFTELHLEFENPEPRSQDAHLEVVVPRRARVSRFAVFVDGAWHDAEVVPRTLHGSGPSLSDPVAPALADAGDGQLVRVRLPKLAARTRHRLLLAYTEQLNDASEPYRVRLAGLGELERFEARITNAAPYDAPLRTPNAERLAPKLGENHPVLQVRRTSFAPTGDLVVRELGPRATGVRSGDMVVARIHPISHDHGDSLRGMTVLFDTSASRALGFDGQVDRLRDLLTELERWVPDGTRIHLVAFDQTYDTVYEGPLSGLEKRHFNALRNREALGASNLGSVLRYAATRGEDVLDRVIVVTDGVVTAGTRSRERLAEAVERLGEAGTGRLDVLVDGSLHDDAVLARVTRELPRRGLVLDMRRPARALTRRLVRGVESSVEIRVPKARWHYPETLDGVQAGDEVLVFAEVAGNDDELEVVVDGHIKTSHRVPLLDVEAPLLERALGQARVEYLIASLENAGTQPLEIRHKMYENIVAQSKRLRLLNEYTALSMLDSPEAYVGQMGEQGKLPGILVAGPSRVELRRRDTPLVLAGESRPRFPRLALGFDQQVLLLSEDASADADVSEPPRPAPVRVSSVDESAVVQQMRHDVQRGLVALPPLRPTVPSTAVGTKTAPERSPADAYEGKMLTVMDLLAWNEADQALRVAQLWRDREPDDPMALVALGESYRAVDRPRLASRAFGSLIDLYPARADVRRFAGEQLETLGDAGRALAIDTYHRARAMHPNNPSSHRLLAFALLRAERYERAFDVLAAAVGRDWDTRYGDADRVLREDLGLLAAAWIRSAPERRIHIVARLDETGATLPTGPSLRFVLNWETAGNDVDLHVRDRFGNHAYHENPNLASGGGLYRDVQQGYGPEVFGVFGEPSAFPYNVQVHYYATGPLGFGMGTLQVVQHDGHGQLTFEDRPFVVMKDRAYLDLGTITGPLAP